MTTARQEALLEYSSLGTELHCPLGFYVFPADPFTWKGVAFIHRGYYAGLVLHFTLAIPATYPSAPPVVTLQTPCFHPLVDPATSRVRIDGRFPQWRPRVDFLFHVLHFLKSMFKRANLDQLTESGCANREAYRLYRDQTPLFSRLASQTAALSVTEGALYTPVASDSAPSPIKFRKLEKGEEQELSAEVEKVARSRLVSSRLKGV